MKQVNKFHGGENLDTDFSEVGNSFTVGNENIRLMTKDGQGFIVTVMNGNVNSFSLTAGFVPIGAEEYNGVLYILSKNDTIGNSNSGKGEIGCYPAPNVLDLDPGITETTGWGDVRKYKPFRNFTASNEDGPRTTFSTSLFGFELSNMAEIEIRRDYDDTINVFYTDNNKPLRMVNSGFTYDTGVQTDRTYYNGSFPSQINVILSPGAAVDGDIAKMHMISIENGGGDVEYGTYFFFARYMTAANSTTTFFLECGPIQIFDGSITDLKSVQGGPGGLSEVGTTTQKIINFQLNNLDEAYAYIQFGYTRFYSDVNAPQLNESWLVSGPISITGPSMTWAFRGDEAVITLSREELVKQQGVENVCKSITQQDNRLWGANWKGTAQHDQELETFAALVKIIHDDSLAFDVDPLLSLSTGLVDNTNDSLLNDSTKDYDIFNENTFDTNLKSKEMQYKDYQKTYSFVGHFRTQAYPFAMKFIMHDNTTSDAYWPRGLDAYDLEMNDAVAAYGTGIGVNYRGVYKFPQHAKSRHFLGGKIKVLGVKFLMDEAIAALTSGAFPFIETNVKSIVFLRGEGDGNVLYQGLVNNACRAYTYSSDATTANKYAEPKIGAQNSMFGTDISKNQNGFLGAEFLDYYPYGVWFDDYINSGAPYAQPVGKFVNKEDTKNTHWGAQLADQHGDLVPTAIEESVNGRYKTNMNFPFYRGYAPAMYVLPGVAGATNKNKNYMSRWYPARGEYAIFSPDQMFANGDDTKTRDIKYIGRVGKTIPNNIGLTTTDAGGNLGNWSGIHKSQISLSQQGTNVFPQYTFMEMDTDMKYNTTPRGLSGANVEVKDVKGGDRHANDPVKIGVSNYLNHVPEFVNDDTVVDSANIPYYQYKTSRDQWWTIRDSWAAPYIAWSTGLWPSGENNDELYDHDIVNMYKGGID